MAKKKYICTGCHKCTEPCTVELSGDADMTKDPAKMLHCGTWVEVPVEEDTNKEQLPKLTTDVFSQDDCPDWAQYAAVDANGMAYWYEDKPERLIAVWLSNERARQIGQDYDASDWKSSLIERPVKEQLPKLTDAVFFMDECPLWAKYAAVDENGKAYWYDEKPMLISQAWAGTGTHFARPIEHDGIVLCYDASGWKTSLIERLHKLTEEIFNHPECPADAVVAVVNAAGTATWGNCADIVCDGISAFRTINGGGYGVWTPIPGGACFDATDWQHSAVYKAGVQPKSTEPEVLKLTHDVFSYSNPNGWTYVIRSQVEHGKTYTSCPEWARYAAVDQSGAVCVYDTKPVLRSTDWCPDSGGRCAVVCNTEKWALRFDITDWKNSLIERNKSECTPKLTPDVFSCSNLNGWQYVVHSYEESYRVYDIGCPEWARYAAVNKSGAVYVYENKPVPLYSVWTDSGGRYAVVCTPDEQELKFDAADWKNSLIERPAEEHLPKLTTEVFSLTDCPAWAQYAAVDADGDAYWYSKEPPRRTIAWGSIGVDAIKQITRDNAKLRYDSSDWQHSLIARPAAPKLTHDVFSMEECPEWARYAAVDENGSAYWYEAQPRLSTVRCWLSNGLRSRNIKHPGSNVSILFDTTFWTNSVIERPITAPKLTHDVFSMEGCPDWARYAAVDADGVAYWYEVPPRLRTESHCWNNIERRAKCLRHPDSNKSILFDADDWEHSLIDRQPAAPRQKLTTEVFSMKECPYWAKYAAVDASGLAYWYDDVPCRSTDGLRWRSTGNRALMVCYAGDAAVPLFDTTDWEHSSIERPAAAPKLTVEVFDMPGCPSWAKYAAVDACGLAYYYRAKPTCGDSGYHTPNRVQRICASPFDATDWQHRIIERPAVVPDWFKPGVLAYNNDTHTFFHVTASTEYCENYLEAKVRPFSADELERKLGQCVLGPNNSRLLVTGYCAEGRVSGLPVICVIGDRWITAEELLTYGSRPQGIKQYHSKGGTWIDCGLSS